MTNPENLLATKHGTAQRFGHCRSCKARVMWVRTKAGKDMPVNVADDTPHPCSSSAPISDIELAWAAGLFEGEGTVRINKPTRRNLGHLVVSITNTDREVLDFFQTRWPGYYKSVSGLDPKRQRPAWVWVVAAKRAAAFLVAIRPFIVRSAVLEKIDHGLAFQRGKLRSSASRTEAYLGEQWNAYWWMCRLNARGAEAMERDTDAGLAPERSREARKPREATA